MDEDDLTSIGSAQDGVVSIDGKFTTTEGSDRVVSYQLDGSMNPVAGVTSHGEIVDLVETANADGSFTYTATADGNPVFTLVVNTDGSYNFTLEGPIDHATGSDELTLNFPIIATDFDGDTSSATIPVTIVDDQQQLTMFKRSPLMKMTSRRLARLKTVLYRLMGTSPPIKVLMV